MKGYQTMRSNFRFCALVLVVSLCGCAHDIAFKDHPHPVTLEVQLGTLSGYKHTFGSDGSTYSYKYSGGDGADGELHINSQEKPNVTVPLHLHAGPTFRIAHVYFRDDKGQLSSPTITNPKEAVIQDKNDETFPDGYYVMIVENVLASDNIVIISCDPRIVNN
jgi:hypothetical protein